jgi:hypothetical protein
MYCYSTVPTAYVVLMSCIGVIAVRYGVEFSDFVLTPFDYPAPLSLVDTVAGRSNPYRTIRTRDQRLTSSRSTWLVQVDVASDVRIDSIMTEVSLLSILRRALEICNVRHI